MIIKRKEPGESKISDAISEKSVFKYQNFIPPDIDENLIKKQAAFQPVQYIGNSMIKMLNIKKAQSDPVAKQSIISSEQVLEDYKQEYRNSLIDADQFLYK